MRDGIDVIEDRMIICCDYTGRRRGIEESRGITAHFFWVVDDERLERELGIGGHATQRSAPHVASSPHGDLDRFR